VDERRSEIGSLALFRAHCGVAWISNVSEVSGYFQENLLLREYIDWVQRIPSKWRKRMRQITRYRTVQGARKALDNGGRFYNLWARAGDDIVDSGELARAAGVVSSDARAFLYFEMALMDLPGEKRAEVLALLSPDLKLRMENNRTSVLHPSVVEYRGVAGNSAIVTGYPVFVEDRTQFTGMIVIVTPIIALIPIMDQYDVYEVFDTPERIEPKTVIATVRGSKRLDGVLSRFGGVLKELQFEDKTGKEHGLFLETVFYTPLENDSLEGF
jgi:hypothetical protein